MEYSLPYFGTIDLRNLDERYWTIIDFENYKLELDINFIKKQIDPAGAERIKQFLLRIEGQDKQNHLHIERDLKERTGETFGYISFHLEECGEEQLLGISGGNKENMEVEDRLLKRLRLVRLGLYPDAEDESYAIFDYSIDIDGEPSNQVLVVRIDSEGNPSEEIDWES